MADGDVCIVNIGPRERRRRMTFGVIGAAIALAIGGALIGAHVGRAWRLVVILPWLVAGIGVLQATGKT
jgi:hypothetical protein